MQNREQNTWNEGEFLLQLECNTNTRDREGVVLFTTFYGKFTIECKGKFIHSHTGKHNTTTGGSVSEGIQMH